MWDIKVTFDPDNNVVATVTATWTEGEQGDVEDVRWQRRYLS